MILLTGNLKSKYVKEALDFFLKELLPRSYGNLTVFVQREELNFDADTAPEAERVFMVSIAKGMSRLETIMALAHEAVHIQQFYRRRLIAYNGKTKWEGTFYYAPYDRHVPWEVEAHAKEGPLVERYLGRLN